MLVGFWCQQLLRAAAVISAISPASDTLAQALFPSGPYGDEAAYQSDRWANTTTLRIEETLGLIRGAELIISDQANEKCWTNADAVSARARAELERSSIAVYEEPLASHNAFFPAITITVLSTRAGATGPCFGSVSFEVTSGISDELGSLAYKGRIFRSYLSGTLWSTSVVLMSAENLNRQTLDSVQEFVDRFSGDVLAGRRTANAQAVLGLFPDTPPMTKEEFDAWLKSAK